MRLSVILSCSVLLNALLLGVLYNFGFKQRAHAVLLNPITNPQVRAFAPLTKQTDPPALREITETFRWSQIESEDYRVYTANLRKLGCPEITVRDIVIADVNELFYHRVYDMVGPLQNRFWELVADHTQFQKLVDDKWKELEGLNTERRVMLQELLGKFERSSKQQEAADLESREASRQLIDFLDPEKAVQYLKWEQRLTSASEKLNSTQPPIPPNELKAKLKTLQEQMEVELTQFLSPGELAECRLRKSSFTDLRNRLTGFQATGDEMRELTRIQSDTSAANSSERRDRIKEFLGPERFTQFERAQNPHYQEIFEVAERFEIPHEAVADAFEMRKAAEEKAVELRSNQLITREARINGLKEIQMETTRALTSALGPEAFGTYRSRTGGWLDALGAEH